jgi:hypothetical protein
MEAGGAAGDEDHPIQLYFPPGRDPTNQELNWVTSHEFEHLLADNLSGSTGNKRREEPLADWAAWVVHGIQSPNADTWDDFKTRLNAGDSQAKLEWAEFLTTSQFWLYPEYGGYCKDYVGTETCCWQRGAVFDFWSRVALGHDLAKWDRYIVGAYSPSGTDVANWMAVPVQAETWSRIKARYAR